MSLPKDPFIGIDIVPGLDDTNFNEFTQKYDVTLVMFYVPENVQCIASKAPFIQAARITKRKNHSYGAVDCAKQSGLCQTQSVETYPTFKIYSKGKFINNFPVAHTIRPFELKGYVEKAPIITEIPRPNCKTSVFKK